MRFALPGYLGIRDDFRERYEQPLAKGGAEEVRERLSRRLRPVLLRRRKRDVAKELPDRIEQTAFCEPDPPRRGKPTSNCSNRAASSSTSRVSKSRPAKAACWC